MRDSYMGMAHGDEPFIEAARQREQQQRAAFDADMREIELLDIDLSPAEQVVDTLQAYEGRKP